MSNEYAIERRLDFIQMNETTREALRSLAPLIEAELPVALDAFYKQIHAFPETKQLFGIDGHIARARAAIRQHWVKITSGKCDASYVASASALGKVHARFGLDPRWYIGGYALILEQLIRSLMKQDETTGWRAWIKSARASHKPDQIVALVKAVMLDIDFVVSAYSKCSEEERRETGSAKERIDQQFAVQSFGPTIQTLSQGDLTSRITEPLPPAYDELRANFNTALDHFEKAIELVMIAGSHIGQATTSLHAKSDERSRQSMQVNEYVSQSVAALNELAASMRQSNSRYVGARDAARHARIAVEFGGGTVARGMAALKTIKTSSAAISDAITAIDEIASQANSLALSASVEAARAGEAGRGFAVVANEIRLLSQRASEVTREGKSLIAHARTEIDDSIAAADDSGVTLAQIQSQIVKADASMQDIAPCVQEQAQCFAKIGAAMSLLSQQARKSAKNAELSAEDTRNIAREAATLVRMLNHFKVRRSKGTTPATATETRIAS